MQIDYHQQGCEFDNLQGIAGYYYALNEAKCRCCRGDVTKYLPRFAGENYQNNYRCDYRTGRSFRYYQRYFGMGQQPTGSGSFRLRRQALRCCVFGGKNLRICVTITFAKANTIIYALVMNWRAILGNADRFRAFMKRPYSCEVFKR